MVRYERYQRARLWGLVGQWKDSGFYPEQLGVLSRGVAWSDFHFSRSALAALWRSGLGGRGGW